MKAAIGILVLFLITVTNATVIKESISYEDNINDKQQVEIPQPYHEDDEAFEEQRIRFPSISCKFPFPKKPSNASSYYEEDVIIEIMNDAMELSTETLQLLEFQYQDDSEDQLHEFNEILEQIEEHKFQIQCLRCAIVETLHITNVTKNLYSNLKNCSIAAVKEPVQIVKDVKNAILQIISDGNDLLKLRRQCKALPSGTRKTLCNLRFARKFSLYIGNTCRSINTIGSIKDRFLAIIPNARACKQKSIDEAVMDVKEIQKNIKRCLGNN